VATIDAPEIYGFTIFCDDIRQEIGGKFTYVGVYRGLMFIQGSFPVVLPKLCLAVTFLQRRDILIANVGIRIFLPGETDTPSIQADFQESQEGIVAEQTAAEVSGLPKAHDPSFVELHAKTILSPFAITQAGDVRVRALRDGNLYRLGGLRVALAPEPTLRT
jgi:hypothetical protein